MGKDKAKSIFKMINHHMRMSYYYEDLLKEYGVSDEEFTEFMRRAYIANKGE